MEDNLGNSQASPVDIPASPASEAHESSKPAAFRKWGGLDFEDENNVHVVPSVSTEYRPHNISLPQSYVDDDPITANGKGKGKAKRNDIDLDRTSAPLADNVVPTSTPPGESHLVCLPTELIDSILSYLSPIDLTSVSAACRSLYIHATAEHLWQAQVQAHVPGVRVTSAYPYASFRALFQAHDPRWFLPKHKIWFSDSTLTGRLILTRYDQRRGCIEGYQLLAVSNRTTFQTWQADTHVIIHAFEPQVKLHLDKPILHLPASPSPEKSHVESISHGTSLPLRTAAAAADVVGGAEVGNSSGYAEGEASNNSSSSGSSSSTTKPQGNEGGVKTKGSRFQAEIPMHLASDTMHNNFLHAQALAPVEPALRAALHFPYGNLWPPPTIPSHHRVAGTSQHGMDPPLEGIDIPSRRQDISDQTFRIRKWLEMRIPSAATAGGQMGTPLGVAGWSPQWTSLPADMLGMNMLARLGLHVGEQVATYSTLDPKLYTPTPEKPYRGIWVGDYSGHGCEFLLINQPDDEDDDFSGPESLIQKENETDEEFARRKMDETVYRGRLEAIKLTGDANVPRGEYTFVVEDLGEQGFVTVVQEPPFTGARVVRSKGHIASTGFLNDKYIESQLLLISHDRLAQYWVGFGHISFFERVNIDKFLVPE
ncbi:hypothetical protein B0T17DRAFT_506923 [Bombardia bombarda]|uniref:F-box domain-containing protein n=1 Tax=Bombardia bombarda TaxID=252184 RepID=A0AA39XAP3_9PEZI|nr:hypothetical protein B0T17DRAFT_506923 [Bombardia bombarda]